MLCSERCLAVSSLCVGDVVSAIGAIGALMDRVIQPRPLIVLGLNVWMGTAAGADELVEIPTDASAHPGPRRTPLHLSTKDVIS